VNKPIYIIIFNNSEIILKGISNIINEIGFEPILIKKIDDFLDHPNLLGYVLLILPQNLYDENATFIEKHFKSTTVLKILVLNYNDIKNNELHINDSTAIIHHKIQNIINTFNDNNLSINTQELTHREIEVLKLIANGFINKEIADKLSISTHTVISHRKNISEKTGIKTISGLTMYAVIKELINIKDINTNNLK